MQLLESIFGAKNKIKVLRHLAKHKNWEFNISELSKDIGLNKGVLSRLVKKLEAENAISVKRKGKIKLFSINKANLFIQQTIIPLFEKEEDFFDVQLKKIIPKLKDKHIISIKSRKLEEKTNKAKEEFLKKDLLLRIDLMSLQEFKKMYKLKEPIIRTIWKNHKILYGKKLNEVAA